MHLATKIGVFDIVQAQPPDDGDGAVYRVSSFKRADLEGLLAAAGFQCQIIQPQKGVMRFQISIGQRDLLDIMSSFAETIDYDRFPKQ